MLRYHLTFYCLFLALLAFCNTPTSMILPSGLHVILQPSAITQLATIECLINFSAFDEVVQTPDGENISCPGLRQVLVRSMLRGTTKIDATQLQNWLLVQGGTLDGKVLPDAIEFRLTIPVAALESGMEIFAQVITHPRLDDIDITTSITELLTMKDAVPGQLSEKAYKVAYGFIFQHHPYRLNNMPTVDSSKILNPGIIRQAYQIHVKPDTTTLALVGRGAEDTFGGYLKQAFGSWTVVRPRKETVHEVVFLSLSSSNQQQYLSAGNCTCVMISYPICGENTSDHLVLEVIETILAKGNGSRLFREIREQRKLAYEVGSYSTTQRDNNMLSLYAITDPMQVIKTATSLTEEVEKLRQHPLEAGELLRAKAYLCTQKMIQQQQSAQYAFTLAWSEMIHQTLPTSLAWDQTLRAITADDVQRVAQRYLSQHCQVIVGGNLATSGKE